MTPMPTVVGVVPMSAKPYHVGHGVIWIITPTKLTALATTDLAVRASN